VVFECQDHKVQTRALRGAGKDARWADAYSLECPSGGAAGAHVHGPLLAAVYSHGMLTDSLIGAGEVATGLPSSTSGGASSRPLTITLTDDDGTTTGSLAFTAQLVDAASVRGRVVGGEEGGAGLVSGAAAGGAAGAARTPSPTRKADVAAGEEAGRGIQGGAAGGGGGRTTGATLAPATPQHGTTTGGTYPSTATATRREGAQGRAEEGLERMREGGAGGGAGGGGGGGGGMATPTTPTTAVARGRRGPLPTRQGDIAFEGGVGSVIDAKETRALEERVITRESVQPEREIRVFEKLYRVTTTFLGERELTDRRRIEKGAAVVREVEATAPAAAAAGAPDLVVEEGAEVKHVPAGPAVATGGVVGVEEGGGGRSIGQTIKATLGLGGGGGGEAEPGAATTARGGKGRTAEQSEAERATLSRAEA